MRDWRTISFIIVVILAILAIHPMSNHVKVVDVNGPISKQIFPNDIINQINGIKINDEKQFYNIWDKINNTFSMEVKREGIPYVYVIKDFRLVKGNSTIYAENTGYSNLKFSWLYTIHNVFSINGSTNGIVKRLSKFGVNDASIIGNKLYTRYSSKLVEEALGYKGNIVGKIGNKTVFTNANIEKYCSTPTGCIYGIRGKYVNGTEKYFYEIEITLDKNAVNNIKNSISNLQIGKCEMGTCYLNESINIFLDNQKIGEIQIPAEYKNGMKNNLIIMGDLGDISNAKHQLKLIDGALAAQINAKVNYIGTQNRVDSPIKYLATAIIIPFIFGLIGFGIWRDRRTIEYGIVGSLEMLVAIGTIALGILVDKFMMYGLIFWSLFFSSLFLFYTIRMRKGLKSEEIKMKSLDLKIEIILLITSFILIIWKPIMVVPLVITSLKLILTRKYFFK